MKMIRPQAIDETNLVASNIVDRLPNAASTTSFAAWNASTTYPIGEKVICEFERYGYLKFGNNVPLVGVFTATISGTNLKPWTLMPEGMSRPGGYAWRPMSPGILATFAPGEVADKWDEDKVYGVGALVGFISGSTGAFYTSLTADNEGNTPSTSPGHWRQASANNYSIWDSGTTYALGERTAVMVGSRGQVYRSLQASNLNHDPSTSSAWWAYEGDAYKYWSTATTYALGDIVTDPVTRHNYESLVEGNLNVALTDMTKWLDLGASNRWAMFDQVNSSQTLYGEAIDVTVQASGYIDTIALMNCNAASVQVICASAGVEVYNQTYDLTDPAGITDWRAYFYEDVTNKSDFIALDLPLYADMTVRVIASNGVAATAIGTMVIGKSRDIGEALHGAGASITDYSRKEADDFGNYSVVQRSFAKRATFTLKLDPGQVDSVSMQLAQVRALPVVWFGAKDYAVTWIYGFYKSFETSIDHPTVSYMNLEVEGLT